MTDTLRGTGAAFTHTDSFIEDFRAKEQHIAELHPFVRTQSLRHQEGFDVVQN